MHATDLVCSCEIEQQHFRIILRANTKTRFTDGNNTVALIRLFTVDLNRTARHLDPRVTLRVDRRLDFRAGRHHRRKQTDVLMHLDRTLATVFGSNQPQTDHVEMFGR